MQDSMDIIVVEADKALVVLEEAEKALSAAIVGFRPLASIRQLRQERDAAQATFSYWNREELMLARRMNGGTLL